MEHSEPGQLVGDLTNGSGTTVVAAMKLGRHGVGVDIACETAAAFSKYWELYREGEGDYKTPYAHSLVWEQQSKLCQVDYEL